MISKYYCISFLICSLNFMFAQQLPEEVTLEQAVAFGEKIIVIFRKLTLKLEKLTRINGAQLLLVCHK